LKYLKEFHSHSSLPSLALSTIKDFHAFSTKKINAIRGLLEKRLSAIKYDGEYCIVAIGSYGRYEACKESDLDVYVIYSKKMLPETIKKINKIVQQTSKQAGIECSTGFESISLNEMHKNIGGKKDTNSSITNRILFLLESECLYNDPFFSKSYEKILRKYLNDIIESDNKPPHFLLSDIIRYYRTICVDYEFKTTEDNKEWALRNIKLRFSRKGLYFGGIAVILNSLNKHNDNRYNYVKENLRIPFADKISHILLEQEKAADYKDILVLYADFLREIGKKSVRIHLDKLERENRNKDRIYSELTGKAKYFNNNLRHLLDDGNWGGKNYLDFLVL
jgi:predicted nucleotidyltransferase